MKNIEQALSDPAPRQYASILSYMAGISTLAQTTRILRTLQWSKLPRKSRSMCRSITTHAKSSGTRDNCMKISRTSPTGPSITGHSRGCH